MTKLLLVRLENMKKWYRIGFEDVVKTFSNDSLKRVADEDIELYNIENGMSKNFLEKEVLEKIKGNSSCVETYCESYIRLENINEYDLFFDDDTEEFFDGKTILNWNTEDYYWYFDDDTEEFFDGKTILNWNTEDYYWYFSGSNFSIKFIENKIELEAKKIDFREYPTGVVEIWETKDGKKFEIDSSRYASSIDFVTEETEDIIYSLQ